MRVEYIFILLFVLMCSGCTVDYELDIDKSLNLNENIILNATSESDIDKIVNYNSLLPVDINSDDYSVLQSKKDNVEYYDIIKNDNNSNMQFKYNYDVDLFNNNVFAMSCYKYVTVMNYYSKENQRNELLLSTSKQFQCFDVYSNLDEVIIHIKTDRKVYSNNADSVSGNIYEWKINRDNYNDAVINMVMDSSIDNSISFWERNMLWIIIIGLLIIGLFIYMIMKKRSNRVNKL